jgi:hypothetical protein
MRFSVEARDIPPEAAARRLGLTVEQLLKSHPSCSSAAFRQPIKPRATIALRQSINGECGASRNSSPCRLSTEVVVDEHFPEPGAETLICLDLDKLWSKVSFRAEGNRGR